MEMIALLIALLGALTAALQCARAAIEFRSRARKGRHRKKE